MLDPIGDQQVDLGSALSFTLTASDPGGDPAGPGLPAPLPWWAQKDNCYIASRDGLDALLIADERGGLVPVSDMIDATLHAVRPHMEGRGEADHLVTLRSMARSGGPYTEQRQLHDELGSLPAVVEALAEELMDGSRARA